MIAAEELDVALERIDVRTADTADGPNEFITAGSGSKRETKHLLVPVRGDAISGTTHLRVPRDLTVRSPTSSSDSCAPADNSAKNAS